MTFSVAVLAPWEVGVNVTLIVHFPLAGTLLPHVLVWAKSLELVPKTAMLEMLKAEAPELPRVTA